ncbi:hypothetical protein S40293_00186 [Stachybotrys chartarum IBT 40293]|nr:hypothetical protein S40293_00186 [Stachybotrys chartarum IBT 40293]
MDEQSLAEWEQLLALGSLPEPINLAPTFDFTGDLDDAVPLPGIPLASPVSGQLLIQNAHSPDYFSKVKDESRRSSTSEHTSGMAYDATPGHRTPSGKVGARITARSIRILKDWALAHRDSPYPSDLEKQVLGEQTGLSKAQVTNWFSNARRRGLVPTRMSSPNTGRSGPASVPTRPPTPAVNIPVSLKSPMQRWVESPPENEGASVAAISRAVAVGIRKSSVTSFGTSYSSGDSSASAHSHSSLSLSGSLRPKSRSGRKRQAWRRGREKPQHDVRKPFQCTFCTETFRTKYDWQRHENSQHLPLERWICMPNGPRHYSRNENACSCVFCGLENPDDGHLETHNSSACQSRFVHDRVFNRKDHLRQHLKLFHNTKFVEETMGEWKIPIPAVRSRCGFCGLLLDSWEDRVHHLGDHFKKGKTMADWVGDWGFEPPILELVEKSMPAYYIDDERRTPYPYEASKDLAETPPNAYELIKLELAHFMQNHFHKTSRPPTKDELQLEACRIILASEIDSQLETRPHSWLREVIMSDDDVIQNAKLMTVRSSTENRLWMLKINGKDDIFDQCHFEAELREYVQLQKLLDLNISTSELQQEACRIVGRNEDMSSTPSDFIATWLINLICRSTAWLTGFRNRAELPQSDSDDAVLIYPTETSVRQYSVLEQKLVEYMAGQRARGIEPSDADLRQQARLIVYMTDEGRGHTAADDDFWLHGLRQRCHLGAQVDGNPTSSDLQTSVDNTIDAAGIYMASAHIDQYLMAAAHELVRKRCSLAINDANNVNYITVELRRWIAATMSPHNPACHVPSDKEIQHYARWMLYNDDDPFNSTIADNEAWLGAFKRDMGIV